MPPSTGVIRIVIVPFPADPRERRRLAVDRRQGVISAQLEIKRMSGDVVGLHGETADIIDRIQAFDEPDDRLRRIGIRLLHLWRTLERAGRDRRLDPRYVRLAQDAAGFGKALEEICELAYSGGHQGVTTASRLVHDQVALTERIGSEVDLSRSEDEHV